MDLKPSECSRPLGLWRSNNSVTQPTCCFPMILRNRLGWEPMESTGLSQSETSALRES